MKVFQLLYISRAALNIDQDDFRELVAISNFHNKLSNITGVLYYRDYYFMQLLEGEEQQVKFLFSKIREDERHFDIKVIGECFVDSRSYSSWMGGFFDRMPIRRRAEEIFDLLKIGASFQTYTTPDSIAQIVRLFGSVCVPIDA